MPGLTAGKSTLCTGIGRRDRQAEDALMRHVICTTKSVIGRATFLPKNIIVTTGRLPQPGLAPSDTVMLTGWQADRLVLAKCVHASVAVRASFSPTTFWVFSQHYHQAKWVVKVQV